MSNRADLRNCIDEIDRVQNNLKLIKKDYETLSTISTQSLINILEKAKELGIRCLSNIFDEQYKGEE